MEEYQYIRDKGETVEVTNYNPIKIVQNKLKFDLNIKTMKNNITFSINDKNQFNSVNYKRTMSLKEVKALNIVFQVLNSFNNFYDYLKKLSANNNLNIKKSNYKISIIFNVEVLFKISRYSDFLDDDAIMRQLVLAAFD